MTDTRPLTVRLEAAVAHLTARCVPGQCAETQDTVDALVHEVLYTLKAQTHELSIANFEITRLREAIEALCL